MYFLGGRDLCDGPSEDANYGDDMVPDCCQIYCSSCISIVDIEKAHEYMDAFFRSAEVLYGAKFLTLNTHLHLHLAECFLDYGPCYGFWLFSFERYNGILGKYHTNQQAIEIQLM